MYKPEIILVNLTNGAAFLFVNSHMVMGEPNDDWVSVPAVAEDLAKSLGVGFREVTIDPPQSEPWSCNEVFALVPRAPTANSLLPMKWMVVTIVAVVVSLVAKAFF